MSTNFGKSLLTVYFIQNLWPDSHEKGRKFAEEIIQKYEFFINMLLRLGIDEQYTECLLASSEKYF
jgi:hypothetical protein